MTAVKFVNVEETSGYQTTFCLVQQLYVYHCSASVRNFSLAALVRTNEVS